MRNFFTENQLDFNIDSDKISIVIPWRETESRKEIFDILLNWYKKEFLNVNIFLEDSEDIPFNLAKTRNIGIEKAIAAGSEVIIVSDADTFCSKDSLIEAINNSINNEVVSSPYNKFSIINKDNFFNNNLNSVVVDLIKPEANNGIFDKLYPCSGVYVINKKVYEKIGGFDENFQGWGPEDIDFHKRYFDEYGKIFDYIEGHTYSLDHSRNDEWQNENVYRQTHGYFNKKHGKVNGVNWVL